MLPKQLGKKLTDRDSGDESQSRSVSLSPITSQFSAGEQDASSDSSEEGPPPEITDMSAVVRYIIERNAVPSVKQSLNFLRMVLGYIRDRKSLRYQRDPRRKPFVFLIQTNLQVRINLSTEN